MSRQKESDHLKKGLMENQESENSFATLEHHEDDQLHDGLDDLQEDYLQPKPAAHAPISKANYLISLTLNAYKVRKWYILLIILFMILTVFVTIFLQSIMAVFPAFIYRLELAARDKSDLKIFAYDSAIYLNQTALKKAISALPYISSACRTYKLGYINPTSVKLVPFGQDLKNMTATEKNLTGQLGATPDIVNIILQNEEDEQKMFYNDNLISLKAGECIISKEISKRYNYNVNDTIKIIIKESMLERFVYSSVTVSEEVVDMDALKLGVYEVEYVVKQIVSWDISARIRTHYKYTIFLDISTFISHSLKFRKTAFPNDVLMNNKLQASNMLHYCSLLKFRLGTPKELYYHRDYDLLKREFNRRSAALSEATNIVNNNLIFDQTMLERMVDKQVLLTLVSAMVLTILTSCILLSGYVISNIFSVMILNRRRDMATMRMLGITMKDLTILYLFQSFVIGLISLVASLPALFGAFHFLNKYYFGDQTEGYNIGFTVEGIFIGLIFSTLVPFISTLLPLSELSKSHMVDDLDYTRSKISAVKVTIESGTNPISRNIIYCCIFAGSFGFSIYFLMPLSILSGDLFFITAVLISLFVALGVGLIMILITLIRVFEWIARFIIAFERKYIRDIVKTNISTHRDFNISVTFVLVIGISIVNIMLMLLNFMNKSDIETDLRSLGSKITFQGFFVKSNIQSWYDRAILKDEYHVAFSTRNLNEFMRSSRNPYKRAIVRTASGLVNVDDKFIGVTPNLHHVLEIQFVEYANFSIPTSLYPWEYLYTRFGQGTAIMSSKSTETLSIDCDQGIDSTFVLTLERNQNTSYKKINCILSADHMPGVKIKNYVMNTDPRDILIDLPSLIHLFEGEGPTLESMRIQKLWMKRKEFNRTRSNEVLLKFRGQVPGLGRSYIFGGASTEESLDQLGDSVYVLLNVGMYGIFLVNFAFGMSNMISQQKQDIGIMNCLGMSPFNIMKIYFYETYVMIVAAGIMGLVQSSIMSLLLGLQLELFIDAIFTFNLPWKAFLSALLFGFLLSLFSTALPVYRLAKGSIVTLLRTVS